MSTRFEIRESTIQGLKIIQRRPVGDARGYLERMFCAQEFQPLIGAKNIVQINHSRTARRGTVRGMHFQPPPHAEVKIVSCLRGEVFDVAVDVRRNSPTFLRWHAEILSAENHRALLIPEGFAHGFQSLSEDCEMLYLHTAAWQPNAECGLNPQDPALDIHWPLDVAETSPRDSSHPPVTQGFPGIAI